MKALIDYNVKLKYASLFKAIIYTLVAFTIGVLTLYSNNHLYITMIAIFQLLFNIFVLYKYGVRIFSIPIIFLIFTFITHLGHFPLYSLNIPARIPAFFDLFKIMPLDLLLTSAKYVIYSQIFLMFGFQLYIIFNEGKNNKNTFKEYGNDPKTLKKIGYILIVIGIIPSLYLDISKMILYLSGNYLNTYTLNTSGLMFYVSNLWKYGAIILMIAYRQKRRIAKLILILSVSYLLISMFTGHRLSNLMFLITILYVYYYVVGKTSNKAIFTYAIMGYIVLIIVNFIADYRMVNINYIDVFKNPSLFLSDSPIFDALGEFGVTMATLCYSIMFFPSNSIYGYGLTYISSFISVIPNVFNLHDPVINYMVYEYNIPDPYSAALGGSYIGELFFNFGNYGVFFTLFIGLLVMHISKKIDTSIMNNNWIITIIYISVVPFLLIWVRGYFRDIIRVFFWNYILIKILYKFIKRS